MIPPTNEEMIEQLHRGQPDEFTTCNIGLFGALMNFGLPEATHHELFWRMREVLEEHPDHAETVNKILRIGWNGLLEHGICPARLEGQYTITLQLSVQDLPPHGTVVKVAYPRISKRYARTFRSGRQPGRTPSRK